MDDHWFDILTKGLAGTTPRRTMLGAAAALVAGTACGDWHGADAGRHKNKKKKRDKKKEKGKDRPKPCGPDDQAECEGSYERAADVQFCKDECARCKAAGLAFCSTHIPDDEHPDYHAACCPRGETCCDFACCAADRCCDEGAAGGERVCCDPDATCCPGQGCVTCEAPFVLNPATCECECLGGDCDGCSELCVGPALACCAGDCVNTTVNEAHCGGCDRPCDPGSTCCAGDCVDTSTDRQYCGSCGGPACTGDGWLCCDGDCQDTNRDEENCGGCGLPCIGPGLECCAGNCVDTRTDPENCGRCNRGGPDLLCCHGHPYDPDTHFCCPDGLPCANNQVCCVKSFDIPSCCAPP